MKRAVVLLLVMVAAAALALPAAAPAYTLRHDRPAAPPSAKALAPFKARPASASPSLLGLLGGDAVVHLNVYTHLGQPESAAAHALVIGDADYAWADGHTDAAGSVTLGGLPAASGNGAILVIPDVTPSSYTLEQLSWPNTGTDIGLQPGAVPMQIQVSSDGYYNQWGFAVVSLVANENGQVHTATTVISRQGDVTTAEAATISTGPETLDTGTIYYWQDEGGELDVAGMAVSPGGTYAGLLNADESRAQAVWLNGWASGKPGTVSSLVFERYPDGWVNAVSGQADYPDTAREKQFPAFTTQGLPLQGDKVTIPSTVKPGYSYYFEVVHTQGTLDLVTTFQTCTLNASAASIRRGGSVRLSGVIPTEGHRGAHPGKAKTLVLYKRTKSAGQPGKWDATKSGWTRVGTVRADRYGKYRSALLHPRRTTWYVVRYPGDQQYWGAFTSVRKVTVR